jgi:hypothetical protein
MYGVAMRGEIWSEDIRIQMGDEYIIEEIKGYESKGKQYVKNAPIHPICLPNTDKQC